ncbi:MAG: hypothetical protein NDI61_02860 [Bdellovibrionaceae bacterium]|nr:hypothetical protein [Pseudobdellovibrionaceae bacterium]
MRKSARHQETLQRWDAHIRRGQIQDVRRETAQINANQIPDELRVDYAQVARRVGAPELILRWLRPLVRPDKLVRRQPTDLEKALYAAGLVRLGAFREAAEIFRDVSGRDAAEIHFLKGSFYINQWESKKAELELRRHIRHPKASAYAKLVSRLNLCSVLLVLGKLEAAQEEIETLRILLHEDEHRLLLGNLYELRSQLHNSLRKDAEALRDLDRAAGLLQRADERSQLYVDKWRLLIRFHQNPASSDGKRLLDELKLRALKIRDWETARECDWHRALVTHDRDYFLRVYWGTSWVAYRSRVLTQFDPAQVVGSSYRWNCLEAQADAPVFDLVATAPTRYLRRLMFVLTREFYRPLRLPEVADQVYFEEYYNPQTTPIKLHRLVARCRQWLAESGIAVQLLVERGTLRLQATLPCHLLLHARFPSETSPEIPTSLVDKSHFTAEDWAKSEGVSLRTALRRIQELISSRDIIRIHSGRHATYKFSSRGDTRAHKIAR